MEAPTENINVLHLRSNPFPEDEMNQGLLDEEEERVKKSVRHSDRAFILIRDYLQVASSLSEAETADSLIALLANNDKVMRYTYFELFGVFCEMAKQIPYQHPYHQKLVKLLGVVRHSSSFKNNPNLVEDVSVRNSRFGNAISHSLAEDCELMDDGYPVAYINFQCFVIRICQEGIFQANYYPRYAMANAFEHVESTDSSAVREAYITGAAQWILWDPDRIYGFCKAWHLSFWKPHYSMKMWRSWKDSFRKVANGDEHGKECTEVASTVVKIMEAKEAGRPVITKT